MKTNREIAGRIGAADQWHRARLLPALEEVKP